MSLIDINARVHLTLSCVLLVLVNSLMSKVNNARVTRPSNTTVSSVSCSQAFGRSGLGPTTETFVIERPAE